MLDTGGCGPLINSRKLGLVHTDLAIANYVAQVVDLALKKCTFLIFTHNWWGGRRVRTEQRWCKCSYRLLLYIRILSRYTTTYWLRTSNKTWFIKLWKVDEALVSPKGVTIYSETISSQKSTTMLILRGDPNLMVPHSQVYLWKVTHCEQTNK